MDPKQIEVECPSCNGRLAIDVLTARVVRWAGAESPSRSQRPSVTEEDWDAAVDRMSRRKELSQDAFEAAFSKERARDRSLDDLFDRAADRALGHGEEPDGAVDRTGSTEPLRGTLGATPSSGDPAAAVRELWRLEEAAARGDRRILVPLTADPCARGDAVELAALPGVEDLVGELAAAGFRPVETRAVWSAPAESSEAPAGDQELHFDASRVAAVATWAGGDVPSLATAIRCAAGAAGARRVGLRGVELGRYVAELTAAGFEVCHHVQLWRRG